MGCRSSEGSCRGLFVGLFLALSLALTGCSGESGPVVCQGGKAACSADSECGGGACVNSCCEQPAQTACTSDAQCDGAKGERCTGGFCTTASGGCSSHNDCANGANKVCDAASGACVACLSNVDCATDNTRVCNAQHQCVDNPGGCASDANCASDPAGPRCNALSHTCVECVSNQHCIGGNVCAAGKCQPPAQSGCTSDAQCSGSTPRCNAQTGKCVACTDDAQCGNGKKCAQASNTCVLAGCASDGECAGNPSAPRCNPSTRVCVACLGAADCSDPTLTCSADNTCVPAPVQGCQSDAGCSAPNRFCLAATHQCVECKATADCATGKDCVNNKCVAHQPTGCQSDLGCQTSADAKKCSIDPQTGNGTCVQCLAGGDCPSGLCDSASHLCKAGCAADGNCPSTAPRCNTTTRQCVACLADGDCGAGKLCQANACVAGCTSSAQCAGTTPKCNTTSRQCVACLADGDCGTGKRCDQNQCVAVQTGGADQPCGANDSCASGSICLTEGAQKLCRKLCDPYVASSTSCGTTKACAWVGFTGAGAAAGACLPKNGRGSSGANCQADGDCELDLLCLPASATTNKCAKLCNPSGTTNSCGTGSSCHSLPAYYDDVDQSFLEVGACLASSSSYGAPCQSDFTSGGPDCGTGMTCGPNGLLADRSIRVSFCQYPFGTGQANVACTDGAACITGDCLGGSKVCNTSCHWTSDCSRAGLDTNAYKCLPYYWLAQDAFENVNLSVTGACQPTCKSDASCGADRTCMLTPTYENSGSFQSGFYGVCYYKLGATSGPNKKAGQRCTQDGECASGTCVTNGRAGATDGYCFGTCDSSATGQCDSANGVVCDPSGVGLKLNDGVDGRSGSGDDAYGRAYVCSGKRCTSDRDCTGASADASKPRSCQLLLQVDGPNNQYGSATKMRTTCEPAVGAKKGGASCTVDSDCATGSCMLFSNNKRACFGACSVGTDCATGSSCTSVNYGTSSSPMNLNSCFPN